MNKIKEFFNENVWLFTQYATSIKKESVAIKLIKLYSLQETFEAFSCNK